jgi:hypothetical protein
MMIVSLLEREFGCLWDMTCCILEGEAGPRQ